MSLDPRFTHRHLFWSNRQSILKGSICLVVVDLIVFALPLLVKLVIDHLQGNPLPVWIPSIWRNLSSAGFISSVVIFYILANAGIAWLRYWWRVHLVWSTFPLFHEMRSQFFRHLQSLDPEFFKSHSTGNLISGLTSDTENIRMTLSIGALMLIDATINFILFPILLWQLSHDLTIWVVPPLILVSVCAVYFSRHLSLGYERVQEITADLSARAFEIASGIRVIKAFRKELPVHMDFLRMSRRLRDSANHVAKYQSCFGPALEFTLASALVAVLLIGGKQVIEGKLALSNLIAFQIYLAHMDWPMNAVGWFIQLFRASQASQKRIQNFARTASTLTAELSKTGAFSRAVLSCRDLGFSYGPSRRSVFNNLNFELQPGGWIGLTGPVGCGKTTLLELLSRQRNPSEGQILYRGESLKTWDSSTLAENILYVPQESFMFSRSLRRNLTLGLDDRFNDDLLWELLVDLSFDVSSLKLRGGLDIRLGERGVNLSGGQRQRISLGRALIRTRDIYLFDDIFSHVDSETELKLLKTLEKRLPPSSTVVLVSQRLETLRRCKEVLIIDKGALQFKGAAEDAISKNSFFESLQKLQSREQMEAI